MLVMLHSAPFVWSRTLVADDKKTHHPTDATGLAPGSFLTLLAAEHFACGSRMVGSACGSSPQSLLQEVLPLEDHVNLEPDSLFRIALSSCSACPTQTSVPPLELEALRWAHTSDSELEGLETLVARHQRTAPNDKKAARSTAEMACTMLS